MTKSASKSATSITAAPPKTDTPMQWSDFAPYVLPYVVGCPEPVLIHNARLTAIEWARKTQCWTALLEPVQANGLDTLIELEIDKHTRINRVLAVTVGGLTWPILEPDEGHQRLTRQGASDPFAFVDADDDTMHVSPVQDRGARVQVRASLMPSLDAPALPQALAGYAQDMAHGMVEKIMLLPEQTFSNPAHAALHGQRFRDRVQTIAAKVSRGRAAAHLRRRPGFF